MRGIIGGYILALIAFAFAFLGPGDGFWARMALAVGGLSIYAACVYGRPLLCALQSSKARPVRAVLIGALSALALYAVFYAGNRLAPILLPFARENIDSIYSLKDGARRWVIIVLISCVIAPGEEIFWRGYLQRQMFGRSDLSRMIWTAAAYTSVHLATGNLMLIVAAMICGLFWGEIYRRFDSLWANIISHVAWDLAVFIIWPFT